MFLLTIIGFFSNFDSCNLIQEEYQKTCCPNFAIEMRKKSGTGRLCTGSILSLPCTYVPSEFCSCRYSEGKTEWTDSFCSSEEDKLVSKNWDVIIVGSGPSGYGAAVAAHDTGLSALVIERGRKPSDLESTDLKDTGYMKIWPGHVNELNSKSVPPLGWININDAKVLNRTHTEVLANATGGGYTINGLIYNTDEESFAANSELYKTVIDMRIRLGLPSEEALEENIGNTDAFFDMYESFGESKKQSQSWFVPSADSKALDRRASLEDMWPTDVSVLSKTTVDTVIFEGLKAVGVKLADGREVRGKKIVLTAGYAGSISILQRSGIGPAELLEKHNIPIIKNISVGENIVNEMCFTVLAYFDNLDFVTKGRFFRTILSKDKNSASQPSVFYMKDLLPVDTLKNSGTVLVNSLCTLNNPYRKSVQKYGSVRIKSDDPYDVPSIDFGIPFDREGAKSLAKIYNEQFIPFIESIGSIVNNTNNTGPSSDYIFLESIFGDFLSEISPGVVFGRLDPDTRIPIKFDKRTLTTDEVIEIMESSGAPIYHGIGGTQHLLDFQHRGKLRDTENLYVADSSSLKDFPWSASSLFLANGYETVKDIAAKEKF